MQRGLQMRGLQMRGLQMLGAAAGVDLNRL